MTAQRGHQVTLANISHHFGDFAALRHISLEVAGGELVALLGPSGCGKSTLLRVIAGFIEQTQGQILFDQAPVDHLSPRRRRVGIVFQNYALFPHMTVAENVAYGLQAQGWRREKIAPRVAEMLALVHMSPFAARKPRQLSGGQQQRIALARCLAVDPQVLLLDEPFGALDKNLRLDMQIEVKRLQREYGITTILVTHDQEEALSMADRIAVMNAGRIEQVSSPTDIYDHPRTLFVNQFVGTTNLVPAEVVTRDAGQATVRLAGGEILQVVASGELVAGACVVSIRPEQLRLTEAAGEGRVTGVVKTVLPLGPNVVYEVEISGGTSLKVSEPREAALRRPGQGVHVMPASPASAQAFTSP